MHKLDGEIEEVNEWIDGAEKKMDEIETQGPNDAVLKVGYPLYLTLWSGCEGADCSKDPVPKCLAVQIGVDSVE